MTHVYRVADLFCGAGGSSTGAARAIQAMGSDLDLVAVNHWDIAIATHTRNHPKARHYCVNLDAARPEDLVPSGSLDLLMASPECVFFSRARGGRPVNDQRRMSAWHVQRWASALDIRCLLVENVPEFQEWGPLDPDGRPTKAKRGVYFLAWVKALQEMGYAVDWKLLNAADYGDATTRTRLFVQARKDGAPIAWPAPTHSPDGSAGMFGTLKRWRPAREVIDWTNPGASLLDRKRPLSLKTRLRIARGLQRFGGPLAPLYIALLDLPPEEAAAFAGESVAAEPFVSAQRQHTLPRSVDEPLPTITAGCGSGGMAIVDPVAEPFVLSRNNAFEGAEHARAHAVGDPLPTATARGAGYLVEPLVEPFILTQHSNGVAKPTTEPVPTVMARTWMGLIEPQVVPYYGTGVADSVDEPLATVTAKARFGLCCPLAVPYGPDAEARSVEQPLPTILTKGRLGVATPVAEPFIVPQFGEREGQPPRVHDIGEPVPAVTGHGAGALVEPTMVQVNHAGEHDGRVRPVSAPMPTVTAKRNVALVEPTLVQIDQTGGNGGYVRPVDAPLPTLTTKRNVALVEPTAVPADANGRPVVLIDGVPHALDIRFRMLQNPELARAMGFDDAEQHYEFVGTKTDVTRQIGNAVAVGTAAALVTAILGGAVGESEEVA